MDIETEVIETAKKIAHDENMEYTKATIGISKGQGVTVDDIYFKDVNGTDYIFVKKFTAGKLAKDILPSFKEVILALNFLVNIRWANNDLRYLRSIKKLLAIKYQYTIILILNND